MSGMRWTEEELEGWMKTRNTFSMPRQPLQKPLEAPSASGKGKSSSNKFNAKKTSVDGIVFDSKLESRRYEQLKLMKQAGEIRWFHRQPSFIIDDDIGERYRPDFIVCDNQGNIWCEDTKGKETADFIKKHKKWLAKYQGFELKIIKEV